MRNDRVPTPVLHVAALERLMCSKRLMGDECFNNFEDKTFHHHKHISVLFLGHMGLHRSTELHENRYFIIK